MQIPSSTTLTKIMSDRTYAEQLCEKMAKSAELPVDKTLEMLRSLDANDLYSIYQMYYLDRTVFQSYIAAYYRDYYGEPIGSLFDGQYGGENE